MRRPTGLALKLYVVSLAQLLTVIAAVFVVHRLTFGAPPPGPHRGMAPYVLGQVLARRDDPAAMRAEAMRAHRELRAAITLYSATGTVTLTNVMPPLPLELAGTSPAPPSWRDGPGPEEVRSGTVAGATVPLGRPRRGPPREVTLTERITGARGPDGPLVFDLPGGGHAAIAMGPPPFARDGGLPPPVAQAAWGVVLALVTAGVASVLLARSFARPLDKLAAAAREIGRGNLQTRVKLARHDELGELADAFDDMADRLAQLLRAQQELLANVSHELRTPLARIAVALDLAAEGDADTAREALGEIAEDLAELQRLVADVLRMARLDLAEGRPNAAIPPVRPEPIDPRALLEKATVRFRSQHPERIVDLQIQGELPELSADPVLVRRVIDNLLDNARKYSEDTIVLRASAVPFKLVIEVIDRGIGIAPEDLPHVATPFFRTDRSRVRKTGGLGLGLSLARRITEAHGGALEVESQVGVGTTVRVSLPPRGTPGAPTPTLSQIS